VPQQWPQNTTGVSPNLSAGSYTTVTDAKGCSITSSPAMVIDALTPPTAMTFTNSAVSCPANKTAITIDSVTGSLLLPLEYRIIVPAKVMQLQRINQVPLTNLDPGVTYRFGARDAKNNVHKLFVPVLPTPLQAA
jgi:hypothetical protein